ncbi:MAG: hypothetical protein ACTSYQ_01735 [Candidatus Odinarchaeia archaeon]
MEEVKEKINRIEELLIELNSKVTNFLGFEELTEEEKRELKKIRDDMNKGQLASFSQVFGENNEI